MHRQAARDGRTDGRIYLNPRVCIKSLLASPTSFPRRNALRWTPLRSVVLFVIKRRESFVINLVANRWKSCVRVYRCCCCSCLPMRPLCDPSVLITGPPSVLLSAAFSFGFFFLMRCDPLSFLLAQRGCGRGIFLKFLLPSTRRAKREEKKREKSSRERLVKRLLLPKSCHFFFLKGKREASDELFFRSTSFHSALDHDESSTFAF